MTGDDRELAASSGAYALHALDGQGQQDFEALLERSPGLRDEVTELSDTAVELGLAVAPENPSAALRASLLDAIATTPQLPRDADAGADLEPERPLAPVTSLAWYRRPMGALLAAAAAVLLVAGGAVGTGIAQSISSAAQMTAIATSSDAHHVVVKVAGGGSAEVVWSDRMKRSGLQLSGLPALDIGRTYQLWYIDGSGARSAGMTPASGDVALAGAMRHGDMIGITVEPAGGSTKPTTTPIMTLATA